MESEQPDQPLPQCGAMANGPLSAGEMRAWRVLRSVTVRLMADLNHDLVDSEGISLSEYEILVRLSEAEDSTLRMALLAKVTDLSRSRLTHTVNRLERRGLVHRFTCDSDRRGVFCVLTEEGRTLLSVAAPGHLAAVKRYFVDRFSVEELEQFTVLLQKM